MKYIKTFESYMMSQEEHDNLPYQKGDYVVLNMDLIKKIYKYKSYLDSIPEKYGIITEVRYDNFPYVIDTTNGHLIAAENEIERKMIPEEIEEFKMNLDVTKYNL